MNKEQYLNLQKKEPEEGGEFNVYSHAKGKYFFSIDEVIEFCIDENISVSDLMLVFCKKNYFSSQKDLIEKIEYEEFSICDIENNYEYKAPPEVYELVEEFNKKLSSIESGTVSPTLIAVDTEELDELLTSEREITE